MMLNNSDEAMGASLLLGCGIPPRITTDDSVNCSNKEINMKYATHIMHVEATCINVSECMCCEPEVRVLLHGLLLD